MARIIKSVILTLMVVMLAGCQGTVQPRTPHKELTEANRRKMELLDRIDARYADPTAHFELGRLYFDEAQYEKAAFHFNVAIGFDPVFYKAKAARVKSLNYAGDKTQAASDAKTYLEQAKSSSEASILLGRAFQIEQLNDYAHQAYKQAVRISPTSPDANKQLAYYYLSRNDRKLAERYFSISFEMDPYQTDVAAELGRLGIIVKSPGPQQPTVETAPEEKAQQQPAAPRTPQTPQGKSAESKNVSST